jgi:rhamnosyltransferase subunit B
VHVAGQFFHEAADAARTLNVRAMLVAGKQEYFPAHLPAGVAAFTYAPYSRVFPRACINVHHGGIGTTAQALRAGKPQLVTPMSHDQFDNAARVRRLGVGDRVLHSECSAKNLVRALSHLLKERGIAESAASLGPKVASEDGAMIAARALVQKFGG